jgi:hypothetical protein
LFRGEEGEKRGKKSIVQKRYREGWVGKSLRAAGILQEDSRMKPKLQGCKIVLNFFIKKIKAV